MATEPLKSILADIRSCKLVLPQFQRDFVWPPSAVIKLLTSLFNGYPIGALLLMENNENYDFRPIDGVEGEKQKSDPETVLVLDGQQRLTACFRAFFGTENDTFKHAGRYYFDYKEYARIAADDPAFESSSIEDLFVFHKPAKIVKDGLNNTAKEIADGLFPLDILFGEPRGSNYADWLNNFNFMTSGGDRDGFIKYSKVSSSFQTDFIEKVTGYQVNFEKITRDTKPDVICTVFETINTTGIKLTVFDLLVAKCFKGNIRLRDKLEEAIHRYENIQFFDPAGTSIATIQLPKIISLLFNGQCRKGDILKLDPKVIRDNWERSVSALDKILGVMRKDFGCVKRDFIPSIDAIAPMAVIIDDLHFTRSENFVDFARTYWSIVFSQYLSGAPETKSARLLKDWRETIWEGTQAKDPFFRNFIFRLEDLDEAVRVSTVYKGLITLLIANGARDFSVKMPELRSLADKPIDDHHIFPQQFLRTFDIKGVRSNGILNRTPILAESNRYISSISPEVYFSDDRVTTPETIGGLLSGHCIDPALVTLPFSKGNFDNFLYDRKKRLLAIIEAATGMPSSGQIDGN